MYAFTIMLENLLPQRCHKILHPTTMCLSTIKPNGTRDLMLTLKLDTFSIFQILLQ